ncbi:unnamed protein product [Orchesella dallaii]|uniref:Uncharacterized protein n=1 Tax=Orchesella dallaii TaxID=48710 RepID=A0ABP1RIX3_9HEXA
MKPNFGQFCLSIFILLNIACCVYGCLIDCGDDDDTRRNIRPKVPSNRPSILEAYSLVTTNSEIPRLDYDATTEDLEEKSLCKSSKLQYLQEKVLDGIERTLKFYDAHSNVTDRRLETIVGLIALKVVDSKYGMRFQRNYPINQWLAQVCTGVEETNDSVDGETCRKMVEVVKTRTVSWKSAKIVQHYAKGLPAVGHEKEYLWGSLKDGCLAALMINCEIPFVCDKTIGAQAAGSQYFLTHQFLYRILVNHMTHCIPQKTFLNEEVNHHQFCAKMYREAELVSRLNYPQIHRHLFNEYVGFCGYMGYPNFFREDWLENILTWQSRSEYGCFSYTPNAENVFPILNSMLLERQPTASEREKGILPNEKCGLPSTTVGLLSLAMHWDYMEENCKS